MTKITIEKGVTDKERIEAGDFFLANSGDSFNVVDGLFFMLPSKKVQRLSKDAYVAWPQGLSKLNNVRKVKEVRVILE